RRSSAALLVPGPNRARPAVLSPLSLHDALPIFLTHGAELEAQRRPLQQPPDEDGGEDGEEEARVEAERVRQQREQRGGLVDRARSEEHTSELQSRENLVCRRRLEQKKTRSAAAP